MAVALIAAQFLQPAVRAQSEAPHPPDAPRPSFTEFLAGIRAERFFMIATVDIADVGVRRTLRSLRHRPARFLLKTPTRPT
jgi:hypothetical protein